MIKLARRLMSRRWVVTLSVGIAMTAAATWGVNRAVNRHERAIVHAQAHAVGDAIDEVGEPILRAVALAMILAADERGLEQFDTEMGRLISRYPLLRSVAVVEFTDDGVRTLAGSGRAPADLDRVDPTAFQAAPGSFGVTEGYLEDDDLIVLASTFPVPGVEGRAVDGELAVHTYWLELLTRGTDEKVHLQYSLRYPDGTEIPLHETEGMPLGTPQVDHVDLGSSNLVIEARALPSTISGAEKLTPLAAAVIGLLLTSLALSILHTMDRRRREVHRLSLETHRLDAALAEQLRVEEQLAHRAYHDPLTELPNRAWLINRLQAPGEPKPSAIFFIDLDGFKVVNDSLGHEVGDRLLVRTSERLAAQLEDEVITRFGGDEFVIVAFGEMDDQRFTSIADRIRAAVTPALHTASGEVFVTASIGVRRIDGERSSPEALLRDADAAMYAAKEMGRDRHIVFHPLVHDRAVERLRLDTGMRKALDTNELHVEYQPIVDLADGRLCGVEALVRWHHPDRGLLLPDEFIPILSGTTLLAGLDEVVIGQAAAQLRTWLDDGLDLRTSVNLSAASLDRGDDLVHFVADIVEDHQLPEGRLIIELTEKRLVDIADRGWIEQLREFGVGISIDDFGTGYSSLSYLRDLPIDFLKLDRSFIEPLGRDHRTDVIVRTVLELSKELGLGTVAEGVETPQHAEILRSFGCDYAQGTWFSPPLDQEELRRHLGAEFIGPR